MGYYLRGEENTLKAHLSNKAAMVIINDGDGFFRKAKYTTGETKTVFELTTDNQLEVMGIRVFLWKGDTLVPEDK